MAGDRYLVSVANRQLRRLPENVYDNDTALKAVETHLRQKQKWMESPMLLVI